MMNTHKQLHDSLSQLIAAYHALLAQLTKDKQLFAQNQIALIDANNESKIATLEQIQTLSQKLKTQLNIPDESALISALKMHIAQFTTPEQTPLLSLIKTLEAALKQCNEGMIVNRQIINANLGHLRDIFRALTPNPEAENVVYDKATMRKAATEAL